MSDEELCRIVQRGRDAMLANLPEPKDCHHEFTPQFEHKMNRLIRKYQYAGTYRTLKRVACFFAAIFLTSSVLLTTNAQAQGDILNWMNKQFGQISLFSYLGRSLASEDVVRYQFDVPDGYWLESSHTDQGSSGLYYVNENGSFIDFSYMYLVESSNVNVFIDGRDSEKKRVTVHNIPATLYLSDSSENANTILWTDPETGALLDITTSMEESQLIALAETVISEEK